MASQAKTLYARERKLFFVALSMLLGLFATYVYFISASVVHVIVRKEIDTEIADVSSRISDLESAFIAAKDSITEETVLAHGFSTAPVEKIYITKVPSSLVLVSNNGFGIEN